MRLSEIIPNLDPTAIYSFEVRIEGSSGRAITASMDTASLVIADQNGNQTPATVKAAAVKIITFNMTGAALQAMAVNGKATLSIAVGNAVGFASNSITVKSIKINQYVANSSQQLAIRIGAGYKYGFDGYEKDDEVSGSGNIYNYGFRIYNSRLGKFLSTDPLSKKYPELTPYQFASNRPIKAIDLDGLEAWDGPNDAKITLSLESYQSFAKMTFKKLDDGDIKIQTDCADFSLYVWAKYHAFMKTELKYTIPGTEIEVSSNDRRFKNFDDFYNGIGGRDDALGYGIRGLFGASQIYNGAFGATEISSTDAGVGDLLMSKSHTMMYYPAAGNEDYPIGVIQAQPSQATGIFAPNGVQFYGEQPYRDNYGTFGGKFMRWGGLPERPIIDSPIQNPAPSNNSVALEENIA